ncbi:response regulator transcription factor [Caloranaerobacter azorensis]|uniref:DNA-binding response regulator, OmpR family, contains REC and winged-helix (WHTH) domain n=3 Tax=Caloranaerobacter azorensis TaxID=116090 RepID=A0A1M5THH8_9FIRM|nr:response regulator transcription factor [Caloranaerobacter azorensis]KGG80171.1 PhoP family transcriptional regulator [Caloranaerobacter azorensis H53214]QIB26638.1 response regulator transcription factor [Caloranaerobacter azorensis]SHH50128.1 DNA-binding response regulator, OmpR family, contains REC and winged-helix (wHTH) domain [Caloranaerobacter azorensis DSM 13643]
MGNHVLIVDDEPLMVKGLKYSLEQDGYKIDTAYDGNEALRKALDNNYDLIILDLMLPGIDGLEVCQKIREKSQVPIIMLTAKGEDINKILGLEYGADDYLTKPFNILELKARMKAILRRVVARETKISDQVIKVDNFTINTLGRKVTVRGKEINLTAKEFDLLLLLASNPGKVFSREELLEVIWGYEYFGDLRTVDVHIRRLREKIEKNSSQPEYILTKWGVGYYFRNRA